MKCMICNKEIEDEKDEIVLPYASLGDDGQSYTSAHKHCCLNGLWYDPEHKRILKDVGE